MIWSFRIDLTLKIARNNYQIVRLIHIIFLFSSKEKITHISVPKELLQKLFEHQANASIRLQVFQIEAGIRILNVIVSSMELQYKTFRMSVNNPMGKEILPTIKKICAENEDLSYSKGRTYQENGLLLKHKITQHKIKNLVRVFGNKLKRNLTSSPPINFELQHPDEDNQRRWFKLKGWNIEDNLSGLILFMDIVMSLAMFVIATYQGLLDNFREEDAVSTPIIILKGIALAVFSVRLIMAMITIDYVDDVLYVYVTDIIKKEFNDGSILLHIFSLIMNVFSLIFPTDNTVGIIFFFASFMKMILIRQNIRILELVFINSMKKYYYWNLIKVVIFNIFFGHAIATLLIAVSKINPESNWISVKLINNQILEENPPWYKTYMWGYYWACTIMMTVGFGDITPVDFREAFIVAFLEIFASIVLAYNINEVGSIISAMRKPNVILDKKLGIIRRMLKKNPIPDQLQWKIQSYLSHEMQIKDEFEYQQHRQIIMALPEQLKMEYYSQANKIIYQNLPFFRHLQGQTLLKFSLAFKGKVYYPGQFIFKGRQGSNQVIIVRSGVVGLAFWKPASQMNGTIVQQIHIDQEKKIPILLTTNILSRFSHMNYDIKALKYSYAMMLPYQNFMSILKESKLDYSFYMNILDKHEKLINPYEHIMCEYCANEYHTRFDCTRLHYIPLKSEVIYHYVKRQGRPVQRGSSSNVFKAKPKIHSYTLRKSFFQPLQKQNKSIKQEREEEINVFEVDAIQNYSLYFKEWNSNELKEVALKNSRRRLMRMGTNILKSIKSMQSVNRNSDDFNIRSSGELENVVV